MEEAGLSTTTLSTIPALTGSVGVPRLAGIGYPSTLPFGPPNDRAGQLDVLRAALTTLESIREPGTRVDLPFEWPEGLRVRTHAAEPPPIVGLLKRKPWLLPRFLARDAPKS
jgi:D-proline reductase (dithiol) PrdB